MAINITFKGGPLTLQGPELSVGMKAPRFNLISRELNKVTFKNFKRKIRVITTFPSLDTPVCDLQIKEFNKRALELADSVVILGVSRDLPFAQTRFCTLNNIDKVTLLSDYQTGAFGKKYGLFIKELYLLARAIIIVDKKGVIRYIQIVNEITNQPNYEEAINKLKEVIAQG